MLVVSCLLALLPACMTAQPDASWGREFLGKDPQLPFFPDANANYWIYAFDRTDAQRNLGIRLRGKFPAARYMSLNLYDEYTLSAIGSMADHQIKEDRGSTNPFAQGRKPGKGQAYTVIVVPKRTRANSSQNILTFDEDVSRVSIILRYYLPEIDDRGGVPLPTLEAFDTQSGEPVPLSPSTHRSLPPQGTIRGAICVWGLEYLIRAMTEPLFSVLDGNRLRSYRFSESHCYANRDNDYLVMPIERRSSEVALIKFKAPDYAKDVRGVRSAQVRYWSISQCDDQSYNHATLTDHEVKISDDGYVRLVIGDPTPRIVAKAEQHNFMAWKTEKRILLIYRNLVSHPSYQHAIAHVPKFTREKRAALQSGDRFIGEYAPLGVLVPEATFVKRGFPEEF